MQGLTSIRKPYDNRERREKKLTFCRPIIIYDLRILPDNILAVVDSSRVAPLAGEENGLEGFPDIIFSGTFALWVLAADRAHGSGGSEHSTDAVLGNDAPEGTGVGCTYGLALVEDRSDTVEEWTIDNVAEEKKG
ncbi:hypothetical protein BC937DRAFT_94968 [Endogone sp. FLAS-F59071]|nr:hypothetical protein BC937DRAFT_94968 [Endogone sp. FLAS-F59071]|eukprot:RUS22919.1 hypothetical protein BC937DRAFT_94968 [Endogone sp. FLAS-F59071]